MNIILINLIVVVGFVLDIILTRVFLGVYKKRFPGKDYTVVETNILVRGLIRRFGLNQGIIISTIIILVLLGLLLRFVLGTFGKGFLAGAYYMMVFFHLTNFLALRRLNRNEKGKK